jgi:hypothetical protein
VLDVPLRIMLDLCAAPYFKLILAMCYVGRLDDSGCVSSAW